MSIANSTIANSTIAKIYKILYIWKLLKESFLKVHPPPQKKSSQHKPKKKKML